MPAATVIAFNVTVAEANCASEPVHAEVPVVILSMAVVMVNAVSVCVPRFLIVIMGAKGFSGPSGSGGLWSTNGLSGDLSSSHSGNDLGVLGGRNGPLAMVDEEEMSLAFLLPRLLSEEVVESGGLSSCVAMNTKGHIRIFHAVDAKNPRLNMRMRSEISSSPKFE